MQKCLPLFFWHGPQCFQGNSSGVMEEHILLPKPALKLLDAAQVGKLGTLEIPCPKSRGKITKTWTAFFLDTSWSESWYWYTSSFFLRAQLVEACLLFPLRVWPGDQEYQMKGDFKCVLDVVEKMDDNDMMISGVHTRPLSTQETSSETSPKDTTSLNWSTMTWFVNVSEDLKLGNGSGWRVINK